MSDLHQFSSPTPDPLSALDSEAAQPPPGDRAPVHLFTLRLWHEDLGDGRREWRGRLHHVGHDKISYFRGWAALLPVLLAMLRRAGVLTSAAGDEAD